jgi:hypothetical protein
MAKMNDAFSFTGPVSNFSVYKMRGIDKLIVRRKGGPSKEKIKNHPRFDQVRKINAEFGGRGTASKWIMQSLWHLKPPGRLQYCRAHQCIDETYPGSGC